LEDVGHGGGKMAEVEEVEDMKGKEDMIGVENMTGVVDMRNDVRKERRSSPQRWQQEVKLGGEHGEIESAQLNISHMYRLHRRASVSFFHSSFLFVPKDVAI
jgi:hypothetical protein